MRAGHDARLVQSGNRLRHPPRIPHITKLAKNVREFVRTDPVQQFRRVRVPVGVHRHRERPLGLKRKPGGGIVDLLRGNTQVEKHRVHTCGRDPQADDRLLDRDMIPRGGAIVGPQSATEVRITDTR